MKIAILNNGLSTLGGGERLCCALASTLAGMGHQVDLVTFEKLPPTVAGLSLAFGPGHDGYAILPLLAANEAEHDAKLAEALSGHDVFINHSARSVARNPCRLGIYWVMFPFTPGGDFVATYHHLVSISAFTAFYTRQRWSADLKHTVIHPCAESSSVSESDLSDRPREIVTIGRFNASGHTKNQIALLSAFREIVEISEDAWHLTIMGRVNAGAETASYVDRLMRECRDLPVRVELDASEETKQRALQRATFYWHGTGIGLSEPHDAARMEHFGIAVVEGMAAGCIPLAYSRGGPREIVHSGVNGMLYDTVDELVAYTLILGTETERRRAMQRAAWERSHDFSRARFDVSVRTFFESVASA